MPRKIYDLTGRVFGRLAVVRYFRLDGSAGAHWECLCECGKTTIVSAGHLLRKEKGTKSCGCIRTEQLVHRSTKHGKHNNSEYRIYHGMISRCYNKENRAYPEWGGRGIRVCDRWLKSFEDFYADMGQRPKGFVIDRIDNDGNYDPKNCRWASMKESNRNKRNNRTITISGVSKVIPEWSELSGVPPSTIIGRLKRGWNNIDAVFQPADTKFGRKENKKNKSFRNMS